MKQAFGKFVRKIKELCSKTNSDKEWLDSQDVCELLSISKRRLQTYRDYGKIPFSTIDDWKEVLLQSHGRRETTIRFTLFDYI